MDESLFRNEVIRRVTTGLPFTLAVYQTLDECLKDVGMEFACRKGCNLCCHQLVSCTTLETIEIIRYIEGLERNFRRKLKRKFNKLGIKWQRYCNEAGIKRGSVVHPLEVMEDWVGKPCPFLSKEGFCDIYPVRIMDCRTVSSLQRCEDFKDNEAGRFRSEGEQWANSMILEKQHWEYGTMRVTPIYDWLLICQDLGWDIMRFVRWSYT